MYEIREERDGTVIEVVGKPTGIETSQLLTRAVLCDVPITRVVDLAAALATVRQSKPVYCMLPAHCAGEMKPCAVDVVQMVSDTRTSWYDKHIDETAVTVALVRDVCTNPQTVAEFLLVLNNVGDFPCAVAQGLWKAAPIRLVELSDGIVLLGTTRTENK